MKPKLLFSAIAIALTLLTSTAYAQTKAPTPSSNPSPTLSKPPQQDDTIQILKDKIEKKVDEINKKSKKVVIGTFVSIADNVIELKGETSGTFSVSIDETITHLFDADIDGSKEIEAADLVKGDRLIITGPILENEISANTIYRQVAYLALQGQITNIDKEAFTIDVLTSEKDEYTLDVEDDTAQRIMNAKTLAIEKAGFSKYKVGDSVHFVIEKPTGDKKTAVAIRTLIVPQEFFTEEGS